MFVYPDGELWKVQFERGGPATTHQTQEAAILAARARVASMPEGDCSQILVRTPDGTVVAQWTYGRDPFPPPAG